MYCIFNIAVTVIIDLNSSYQIRLSFFAKSLRHRRMDQEKRGGGDPNFSCPSREAVMPCLGLTSLLPA